MKSQIANLLLKYISLEKKQIENLIEIPPSQEMGDFAFPCFVLAKEFKKNPIEIAREISQKIKTDKFEIKNSGPYINFFLNRTEFAFELIEKIKKEKENFGKKDVGKKEKILIEHTSINPNASPHVGRARNALIGDSLVKIFRFLNFDVDVHYLVNDVSKQIAMLVLANADKLKFEEMLKRYVEISAKVKESKKLEKKVFGLLHKFEQQDKTISEKFKKITFTCVEGQKKILADIGIHYNSFDYESSYI